MAFRADQPPSRRWLVAAAVVVVASLGAFALIAEDVLDGGGLISHDEAVLSWFVANRSEWLITAARWVSTVGGFAGLCIAAVAAGAVLWSRHEPRSLAVAPLLALLVGGLASFTAKIVFGRERPPITVHETTVGLASFPSAHTTDAAAFFWALGLVLALTVVRRSAAKVAVVAAAAGAAGVVGLSRLVLAVHWLSDVVAGWALGTAIATATVAVAWVLASGTPGSRPDPAIEEGRPDPADGLADP